LLEVSGFFAVTKFDFFFSAARIAVSSRERHRIT
jgi:hypothetical protein